MIKISINYAINDNLFDEYQDLDFVMDQVKTKLDYQRKGEVFSKEGKKIGRFEAIFIDEDDMAKGCQTFQD